MAMKPSRTSRAILFALLLSFSPGICRSGGQAAEGRSASRAVPILDNSSYWRVLETFAHPIVKTAKGLEQRKRVRDYRDFVLRKRFAAPYPPAGWAEPEFDDSGWRRRCFHAKYANGQSHPHAGGGGVSYELRQLTLRGKFTVTDPAAPKGLRLSLAFRGGAIVYLNGTEVARAFLPPGKVEPGALGEIYPDRAYVKDDGTPYNWYADKQAIAQECYPLRVRRLDRVAMPARLLRKGVNVLGVEIHGSAYHQAYAKLPWQKWDLVGWATCGLVELHLRAERASGVVPNLVRPKGVQIWNANTAEGLTGLEYGDPNEPLRPISIAGARNGAFSGRVVVGSDKPIRKLRARINDLTGPGGGRIPASVVDVGFGKFDVPSVSWASGLSRLREQAILPSLPEEVPVIVGRLNEKVRKQDGLPPYVSGAVRSVWVTVNIPRSAAPGGYKGTLTVALEGNRPLEVPVRVNVIDWTLPDPADFTYFLGLIQSPEGVAQAYDVKLWSHEHWEKVGKSLEYVGRLGGKVLYIPLGAESQYGNSESMVRWIKGRGGRYTHDFGRVEKYVDLALKRMGRPQFVVVGVWDSCCHVSAPATARRNFPRVTLEEAKTKIVKTIDGPVNGTPESLAFWKPVLPKVREILAKRHLAKAMLLGYLSDRRPDKATVGAFHQILPGVGWQSTNHIERGWETMPYEGGTVPVRYSVNVWGGWSVYDPEDGRNHGWKFNDKRSIFRVWLDRGVYDKSPTYSFRLMCEQALMANRPGLGQIGADFWRKSRTPGRAETLMGRFIGTQEGNLGAYTSQLLYPGPGGPCPAVAYVMVRENIQECEARIFLERMLLAKKLPEAPARRCRALLDERQLWHQNASIGSSQLFIYSGWEARSRRLFEAAAEAAKALAGAK